MRICKVAVLRVDFGIEAPKFGFEVFRQTEANELRIRAKLRVFPNFGCITLIGRYNVEPST